MTPAPLREMDQRRLDDFRSFYGVLIELRDRLRAANAEAAGASPRLGLTVEALQQRLREKLGELGYGAAAPRDVELVDAGYIMVAMADEVMLMDCGEWRGRASWADRPLEMSVYGTRLAGARVFETAERLVAGLRDESGTAILILACILLGYRGRYRSRSAANDEKIEAFRGELYKHVHGGSWSSTAAVIELETAPLTGHGTRRLPTLWPWLAAIAAVMLFYAPVSHVLWRLQVNHVGKLAETILGKGAATTDRRGP